jgi:hypothetical protein
MVDGVRQDYLDLVLGSTPPLENLGVLYTSYKKKRLAVLLMFAIVPIIHLTFLSKKVIAPKTGSIFIDLITSTILTLVTTAYFCFTSKVLLCKPVIKSSQEL